MKKLACAIAGLIAIGSSVIGLFTGCSLITVDIKSVDELYNMEKGKKYNLACDLDLGGRAWTPLKVKSFNGNNYTIKNANITNYHFDGTDMTSGNGYVGFLASADEIRNLNLSNIVVNVNFPENNLMMPLFVSIACGEAKICENVHVSDSTLIATVDNKFNSSIYMGGIVGGYYYTNGSIKNCTVDNCNFNYVELAKHNAWCDIGGITGYSYLSEFGECKVTNCEFKGKFLTHCNAGGVLGEIKSSNGGNKFLTVSNCVSKNNKFNFDTTSADYSIRAGGVVGNIEHETITIEKCLSSDNSIDTEARANFCLGGFVGRNCGTIKNCLVHNANVSGKLTAPKSGEYAYAGGACGSNYKSVSRCVVQDSYVYGTTSDVSQNYLTGGFAAHTDGSVAYCGAKNIDVHGNRLNKFTDNADFQISCLDCEEWANDVLSQLNLEVDIWSFYDGKLWLKVD